jgi:hypothetical protein
VDVPIWQRHKIEKKKKKKTGLMGSDLVLAW